MQETFLGSSTDRTDRMHALRSDTEYEVNVALVFQDEATRQWAGQVRGRLAELVGEQAIRHTEWNVGDLGQASVFSQSSAALGKADVIVVSLYEAERLPPPFYLWVNLWLQARRGHPGALVALVARNGESSSGRMEIRNYLCSAATQGRLDWLECNRPGALASRSPLRVIGG